MMDNDHLKIVSLTKEQILVTKLLWDRKWGHSLEEFPRKKILSRPQIRVTNLRVVLRIEHYNF